MWIINLWFVVAIAVGIYQGWRFSSPMYGMKVGAKVAFFPFVIVFMFSTSALSLSRS